MAMRRSVFARVGYFDELIGPGGIIPSGDDRDFLYRAVRVGCQVLMTPDPEVIHHDYRAWEEDGGSSGRANSIGLAVPYAKFIRRRDTAALYHYLSDLLGDARQAAGRVARMRRPLGSTASATTWRAPLRASSPSRSGHDGLPQALVREREAIHDSVPRNPGLAPRALFIPPAGKGATLDCSGLLLFSKARMGIRYALTALGSDRGGRSGSSVLTGSALALRLGGRALRSV